MEIKKIIQIQFNDIDLEHFHLEVSAQVEDRFFAYIIIPVDDKHFTEIFNYYLQYRSHSSCHNYTEEEKKKLTDGPLRYGGWSAIADSHAGKSITEQISEGRFNHVSIVFTG